MSLAVRIIPTLLCRGRQLVKGKQFNSWRSVGLVAQAVRIHQARAVDELVLLDIGATPENRGPDLALVEELTADCFMPISVGGGVRKIQDVQDLLNAGADKVIICTAAVRTTEQDFLNDCTERFGSQAIVAALDYRRLSQEAVKLFDGAWLDPMTQIRGGAQSVAWSPVQAAIDYCRRGAGEILLTRIDREGTLEGYDLDLIRYISRAVDIPVIAHGGCGTYEHMLEAIQAGASAVAAGAMFQFTDQTPRGAAEYLHSKGIEVRL